MMMDRDELSRRLMSVFLDEFDDHVKALDQEWVELEKTPAADRAERLAVLYRIMHTLKGAARSVELPAIELVAHRLESLLAAWRQSTVPDSPAVWRLVFAVTDALRESAHELRTTGSFEANRLKAFGEPLAKAAAGELPETWADVVAATTGAGPTVLPAALPALGPLTAADVMMRFPASRIDGLMAHSSELAIARRRGEAHRNEVAQLREFVETWYRQWKSSAAATGPLSPRLASHTAANLEHLRAWMKRLDKAAEASWQAVRQSAEPLDDEIRQLRMVPFSVACEGLERTVRDVAAATQKRVEFSIEADGVAIDRAVAQALRAPLMHLVRNAVDHGIETPAERDAAGKPSTGRILVRAVVQGSQVEIDVADDGRGVDWPRIHADAAAKGWPTPSDPTAASPVIFAVGISTAAQVTEVSGRGIGLNSAKADLDALHGTISLHSPTPVSPPRTIEAERVEAERAEVGGAVFRLTVPLSSTVIRALLVEAGGQIFAIAGTHVVELLRVEPEAVRRVQGRAMLDYRGDSLIVADLADVLELSETPSKKPPGDVTSDVLGESWNEFDVPHDGGTKKLPIVVMTAGTDRVAVIVDTWVTEREVLVKPLGKRLAGAPVVAGATVVADGRVALVLKAGAVVRAVTQVSGTVSWRFDAPPPRRRRVVVADDSPTTCRMLASVLRAAGFVVDEAADGEQAWQALQTAPMPDALISDVEMPTLDGLALTRRVRLAPGLARLPVVLVTGRDTDADRLSGLQAGADAYVCKQFFDPAELVRRVWQLIGSR